MSVDVKEVIGDADPTQAISALDLFKLLDQYHTLKNEKDLLKKELEAITAKVEIMNDQVIQKMVEMETQSVNRGGYTYSMNTRVFASPIDGCKEKFFRWLKRHGYKDLVKESVNSNTLNSQVKEWMEDDGQLPKGVDKLLKTFEKVTVAIRKGKG